MSNNDLWCSKCKSQHHPAEDCAEKSEGQTLKQKLQETRGKKKVLIGVWIGYLIGSAIMFKYVSVEPSQPTTWGDVALILIFAFTNIAVGFMWREEGKERE